MPQSGGQARVKVAQWAHWHRSQSRLLTSLSLHRNTLQSVVVFCCCLFPSSDTETENMSLSVPTRDNICGCLFI